MAVESSSSSSRLSSGLMSSVDRGYLTSICGVLTMLATILAFASMVAVFSGRYLWEYASSPVVLQEFASTASFLLLLTFHVISILQLYRKLLQGPTFKFLVAGHSAVWALLTLISSSVLLDHYQAYPPDIDPADAVSGVMSLLESFALIAVSALLFLDLFGIRRQYIFD